ncbi:MAG: fibronectin type III domain-containing protein [bacterium]
MALLCVPWVTQAQNSWTVADGTTTIGRVPLDFYNCDGSGTSTAQMLYPAELISDMAGNSLSAITFYHQNTSANKTLGSTWTVKIGTTTLSDLSEGLSTEELTTVYTGNLVVSGGVFTFEFDVPYVYESGNLLVELSTVNASQNYFGGSNQGCYGSNDVGYTYTSMASSSYNPSSQHNAFLPKTTFSKTPTCFKPTFAADAVSNITTTGATITWTSTNDASATFTFYNGDVAIATDITPVADGENVYHYNLTGLTPSTNYGNLTIVAHCSGEDYSDPVAVPAFATACEVVVAAGYTENFDDYSVASAYTLPSARVLPVCWSAINTTTYSTYIPAPTLYYYSSTNYAHSAPNCLKFYSVYSSYSSYDPQPQYAVLPQMTGLAGRQIVLWARGYNATSTFKIGLMTDPTDVTTFVPFTIGEGNEQALTTSYQEFSYDIPMEATAQYIAIMIDAANSSRTYNGVYIDDISIVACPATSTPVASEITTTSAVLDWTSSGSAWVLAYKAEDAEEFTEVNVTTKPYTLSGLASFKEYTVKVRANCGEDGLSEWSGEETFTTLANCQAPVLEAAGITNIAARSADVTWTAPQEGNDYQVSYRTKAWFNGEIEDFSSTTLTGWLKRQGALNNDGTATLTGTSSWSIGTSNSMFGGNHAYLNLYSTKNYWLITPSITVADGFTLRFDIGYTAYSGNNAAPAANCPTHRFAVLISTDEMEHWTILREWNNSGSAYSLDGISHEAEGQTVSDISLNSYVGQTVYIAFFAHSETSSYDNNFHLDNVAVGLPVAAGEWQTSDAISALTTSISGLEPETQYEVKVEALCDDDVVSAPSDIVSFTTQPSCMPVTAVVPVDTTANSYTLNWTDGREGDAAWQIQYRVAGTNAWSEPVDATEKPFTLTGLTPATDYQLQVRTNCGETDGTSAWSATVTFTTECAALPVPYTQNFETSMNCWLTYPVSGTYTWTRYSSNAHAGSYALRSYTYSSNSENYAVLPQMSQEEHALNTLLVHFWTKSSGATAGTLEVGYVLTDVPEGFSTSFNTLATFDAADYTTYKEVEVDLTDIPEGVLSIARIALKRSTETTSATYWYVDDLSVELQPSCRKVQGVTAVDTTSTTFLFTVTDNKNSDVTYSVYDTVIDAEHLMMASTQPGNKAIIIPDLNPNTTYNKMVVVANCGNEEMSALFAVPAFRTLNAANDITSVTLTAPAGVLNGEIAIDAENHTVTIPVYYLSAEEMGALAGAINKSTGATVYAQDANEEWTVAVTNLSALRELLEMNVPLTLRVKAEDEDVYQDWTLTLQGEDCNQPRNLAISEVTRRGFQVDWGYFVPGDANFQLVVSDEELDAESLETAPKIAVANATTYTASELNRGTEYYVYVRTVCGPESYSEWVDATVTTGSLSECTTVGTGTSATNGPVNANYGYERNAYLFTAEDGINSGVIEKIAWNYNNSASGDIPTKIYLKNTDATALSATTDFVWNTEIADATLVYDDTKTLNGGWNEFVLATPFTYTGGNLIVYVASNYGGSGSTNKAAYYTASGSNNHIYGRQDNSVDDDAAISNMSQKGLNNQRHNIQICVAGDPCPAVASVEIDAESITDNGATITWEASDADYLTNYKVYVVEPEVDITGYDGLPVYTGTDLSYTVTGLNAYTYYKAYVLVTCNEPEIEDPVTSTWAESETFRTLSACGTATNITAQITGKKMATLTWEMSKPEQDKNFTYIYSTTGIALEDLDNYTGANRVEGYGNLTVNLTGLTNGVLYHFYIQNNCGGEGISPWDSVSFETYEAWPVVLNLAASHISYNAFTASWNHNTARFASEGSWQVALVEPGTALEDITEWQLVSDSTMIFSGLTAGTSYDLHVRPCAPDASAWGNDVTITVTTLAMPMDCDNVVADGATSNGYVMLRSAYQDENHRSQVIYPADMLTDLQGKTITGMTFFTTYTTSIRNNYGDWAENDFTVSLGITESEDLSTEWDDASESTVVHTGAIATVTSDGLLRIEFSTPFVYEEGNLLVELRYDMSANPNRYTSGNFYGVEGTGMSRYANGSNALTTATGTVQNFLPKVQFCSPIAPDACLDVVEEHIAVNAAPRQAIATWYAGNVETSWQYYNGTEEMTDEDLAAVDGILTTNTPSVTVTGLTPETDYHFYVRPVCGTDNYGAWSHAAYTSAVSCGIPELADVEEEDVTNHEATLSVVASTTGTPASYEFMYWKEDEDPENAVTVTSNEPTVTLTGLPGNTVYYFTARTLCTVNDEDYSQWNEEPKSFRTLCADITLDDLPYTCDFEDNPEGEYQVPYCWSKQNSNEESVLPYSNYNYYYSHSGNYSLYFAASENETMYAKLPKLDASLSPNSLQVVFYARTYSATGNVDVRVGTMNDEGAFHATGQVVNINGSDYEMHKVTFTVSSEYATDRYIAFRVVNPSDAVYVDDVTLRRKLACEEPVDLTDINATSSSIMLQWTKQCNNVEPLGYILKYEYEEEEVTVEIPAANVSLDENEVVYNLLGLEPASDYYFFRVAAVINSEDTTEFSEPLEYAQTLNNEFAITDFAVAAPEYRDEAVIDAENHTVTMPVYYAESYQLAAFEYSDNASVYAKDENEEFTVDVLALTPAERNALLSVTEPLVLRVVAEDPAFYADWTITLEPEACCTPAELTFSNVGRRSFTASWTAADPAAVNFQLMITTEEEIDTEDEEFMAEQTLIPVAGNTYTFEGLDRGTDYYVYVRTACGEDYSNWITAGPVTTETLTFCADVVITDGSTNLPGTSGNRTVPLWGYWTDNAQHSQMIYPASMLTNLQGKELTGMKYFVSSGTISSWNNNSNYPFSATFTLKVTETENLSAGWDETTGGTAVFTGMFESDGSITFTTPFTYTGGNLLVDINLPVRAAYSSVGFYGETATNASRNAYGSDATGTIVNFLPKVQFHYCEDNEACPAVAEVTVPVESVDVTTAVVNWTAAEGDYLSSYDLIYSTVEMDAEELDAYEGTNAIRNIDGLTYTLEELLLANTDYYVYVRANCDEPDPTGMIGSTWVSATFKTQTACKRPTNLVATQTAKNNVLVTWEQPEGQTPTYEWYLMGVGTVPENVVINTGLTETEVNVTVDTTDSYTFFLRSNCGGEDGESTWEQVSFDYNAMPAVINLAVDEITHSAARISWARDEENFADETAWQVTAVSDEDDEAEWTVVNEMNHSFIGLTPETEYNFYVRPYNAATEAFGTETFVTESTNVMPSECLTIGEGTTGNNSLPFAGYYNYSYTQQLFDEEEMNGQEGLIEGLKFNYYRATTTLRNVTVYMGTTEETSLATGWITPANMTEVFHAANVTFSNEDDNWFTLTLDEPFEYNGGNVVVAMYMNNVPERTAYDGTTRFYTTSVTGKARYYQVDGSTPLTITGGVISGQNGNASTNRDNIQFCFEPSECRGMSRVTVSDVTMHTANVSWMPGNAETSWQYLNTIGETAEEDRAALATTVSNVVDMALADLTADEEYHFYIRPVCDADDELYGDWKERVYNTLPSCGQPTVLAATSVTATGAMLHAAAHETVGTPESFQFRYWVDGTDADAAEPIISQDDSLLIGDLMPNTVYHFDVRTNCGEEDGYSRWSTEATFRTELVPIDLPYTTVFDEDNDGDWALENGTRTNAWTMGNAASNTENGRGLYISNDGGENNAYSDIANYYTYAFSAFNFEADKQYTLSFQWKSFGGVNAYLRAYLAPEDAEPNATVNASSVNTSWTPLTESNLAGAMTWQTVEYTVLPKVSDTTMKLVFVWYNIAGTPLNPPAAIDSVVIRESDKYTVNAVASLNDDEEPEATIEGAGEYYVGSTVTVTAEPVYGYHIVNWVDENDEQIAEDVNSVEFVLTKDTNITVVLDSNLYTITGWTASARGHVEIEGVEYVENEDRASSVTVKYNKPVTLIAVSEYGGIRGNKWLNALNEEVGYGETFTVPASSNLSFSAVFDTAEYHITTVITKDELHGNVPMGTVEGPTALKALEYGELVATANYGYHFVNWTREDGSEITTDATLPVDFTELDHDTTDFTVNANFDYDQFTVAAVSADVTMGTVEGTATENYLTTVTLTATPAEGYHLVNWMEADTVYATTEEVEVVANADRLFTANFAINTYTVTLLSEGTGHGTMTFTPTAGLVDNGDGTATVNQGTTVTIRAVEATCHSFVQWNTEATTRRIDTVITEDVTLTATFDSIEYSETVTENVCDMFVWKDVVYTETPEVAPSVIEQTAAGCDSTVTLNLTVRHSNTGIDVQNMCGDYTWINGETYTETPAEAPIFTIENGNAELCDSVVTLNLTINRPVNTALTEVACESYTWEAGDGETYTESGEYTFSHEDAHGCTQVDTLYLTINNPVHTALTEVACESYTWEAGDGETYTESGDYLYEHLDANECTQVDTLHLTINTPVNAVLTMVACDSYTWTAGDGETYTESGDYLYEHLDANECAQVDTLYLTVNYSTTGTDVQTACNSFTWIDGITYNTNNMTAQFTIQNAAQCDSVVTLNLTINRSYTGTDYVASCDSAEWHDTWYYTSNNTATYTYEAANGCDSVITLNLTLSHSSTGELTEEVCNVFVFGGETYNESGVYTNDFYKNSEDCDSIVTLNLTILNCATTTLTVCDSYTWSVTGLTYTESGTYFLGDDTLILTVNYSTSSIDEQTACSQYLWHGAVYTESTDDAVFSGSTAAGCDSTVTLHLTITGASTGIDEQTACDSYTWIDGLTYTENNNTATYTLTEADQNGCDSVVTLNLTINRSTTGDTAAVACDQFTWYGQTYTATPAVAPTHVFTNAAGCDSTVTLNLTINNSSTGVDEQTACNEYTWIDGETYTEVPAEAPTFTLTNAAGCDSVVTLNLTLNYSTTGDTTAVACDEFTWYGTTYTETPAEAPTHVFTNAAGCDSTVTLNLTINASANGDTTAVACDSFDWYEHTALTESSDNLTHVFEGVTAAGCDSTVTLHLTINLSTTGVETVAACGSYTWHEIEYTASTNEPTFTEEAANGCDSVVTLHLTINNPVNIAATRVACVSYTWNDSVYTESGDYLYEHLDANGCTQVDTLHLTINVPENEVTNITQCGGSYTWYGVKYETSGDYTHQLLDDNNCTQVDTLHLTINTPVNTAMTDTACESYTWNDETYTESGDYTYSHADANGCTQVDTLHLTINTPVHTAMTEVACESYTWEAGDGETYTESGDYTFSHEDANGCTQVDTLHLTINNPVHTALTAEACDSYTWHGETYTESGDYTFSHEDANGCTQVDTLYLTIKASTTGDTTATACDSYTWYGTEYYATPAVAPTHTFVGANGCDSIVTLNLTMNYSRTGIATVTACDSYEWINGVTYTASTSTPTYTVEASNGCDSVVTLRLTINYSTTGVDVVNACDSYEWIDGVTYTETPAEAPTFTLTNAANCDSVVTLNLTLNYSSTGIDEQTACDSYTWIDGETYTEVPAEAPTFTLTNAAGCDSVVTLNLTLNYSTTGDTSAVACDQFTWYGQTYTATPAVAPTHVFTNAAGCDSTVTLNLTINNSNTGVDEQTACNSYTWINGETYTEVPAEAPTFTLTNAAGCDSVVTLNLTLNYSNTGDTTAVACNSFTWYGQTYTATPAVAPTHVFTNAAGCDSVVTLNLTINQPMNTEETVTACVRYAWYGTLYNESGNYTHNIVDENGCNAVATLHLTITPSITVEVEETACDAYVWNDTVITESGVYTYNTTSATTNCDSTTILTLTITNTVNTSVDAVACGSYTWNGSTYTASGAYTYTTTSVSGCDSVVTLNLTINQSVATTVNAMACESYTWNGATYNTSGAYVFDTIAANGCDSTVTLLLIVNMPTATTVEVTAEGSYEWNGEVLTESGTYTYTYTGSNGCDSVVTLNLTITVADFEVTVLSSDETRGSVSPAGVSHVAPGDFFTVTATARSGNQFVAWKVDNEVVSTEATYTFAVNADMTITAEFDTVLPQNYIIAATVNDTSLGMVIGAGEYTAGSTVTLIARAKGTGRFVRWSTGETDSVLTFRATEDVSLVAIFVNTVGIDDIDETEVNIYAVDNQIVVKGAENQSIYIYDVNGRCVRHQATVTAETIEFTMTNTGVYLVKVGNAPAKRVVVLR